MLDADERVTARIQYTIDLQVPGMLHAKLLRSRHAHARIVSIDTTRAKRVPGVAVVLTGADLAGRADLHATYGPVFRDQPILAIGKVRYVGEPVVAVAAVDTDTAQQALDLVEIEYEELPAVFTVEEALAPDAPLVHEEPPRPGETFADLIIDRAARSNICNHFKLRKGDVERGFAASDEVFEHVFTSPPVQHVPMETHACIADVRDGRVTLWDSAQIPFSVRSQIAEIFKIPQTRVRVIIPMLGGGYGAKCYPKIEPVTAMLSYFARKPVRLHLTREEEFHTITKHGVSIRLKTGIKRDGTIVARQSDCKFNGGAYADIGPRLIKNGGFATGGPHHIPNVWVDSYKVYTNIVPAGAFRGYGVNQAAWAYETQMDMIAEAMGFDPYAFRMQNLLVDGQTVMTGEAMFDARFHELLERAATWIGWEATKPVERHGSKVRAKGLACIIKATVTPSTSVGKVNISMPDTDVTPYDQQTSSSRTTHAMSTAIGGAIDEVRDQLRALGAEQLEAAPTDLELVDGVVRVKGSPDRAIDFGQVIRNHRAGNLLGSSTFRSEGGLDPETGQGIGSVHWHQAAGAAEVEVDLETGKVDLLRYHAGVYAGRILNPVQAELQTEGNVAFGVGQALFEDMIFDAGQLQNGNLGDYMIASIEDLPEINADVIEHLEANDIHGIGETSLPPVMPAIGNAVYRATGVRITDLPITPEKVLRGLRARADEEAPAS